METHGFLGIIDGLIEITGSKVVDAQMISYGVHCAKRSIIFHSLADESCSCVSLQVII